MSTVQYITYHIIVCCYPPPLRNSSQYIDTIRYPLFEIFLQSQSYEFRTVTEKFPVRCIWVTILSFHLLIEHKMGFPLEFRCLNHLYMVCYMNILRCVCTYNNTIPVEINTHFSQFHSYIFPTNHPKPFVIPLKHTTDNISTSICYYCV